MIVTSLSSLLDSCIEASGVPWRVRSVALGPFFRLYLTYLYYTGTNFWPAIELSRGMRVSMLGGWSKVDIARIAM
jgi:hypothetical protein